MDANAIQAVCDSIVDITGVDVEKSSERINGEEGVIEAIQDYEERIDSFEWSDEFTCKQSVKSSTIYYTVTSLSGNMDYDKDDDDASYNDEEYEPPVRFLRILFEFMRSQFEYLLKNKQEGVYFVNILDGNIAADPHTVSQFEFARKRPEYSSVAHLVFCGDLTSFSEWYASTITS